MDKEKSFFNTPQNKPYTKSQIHFYLRFEYRVLIVLLGKNHNFLFDFRNYHKMSLKT